MVSEHIKYDFKPQTENLYTAEDKLSKTHFFKIRTYLWFLFALFIFIPCIGISTFSIIMVNNLHKEVDYLKEQIQNLKLSLTNTIVNDIKKFEYEDVYGKLITSPKNEPPLHEYDDYTIDEYLNYDSEFLRSSDEEDDVNSNENILKIQEQVPLGFLKVGEESKRMRRSFIDSTTEIPKISSVSNTNSKKINTTELQTTEKHKNLKLHENHKSHKRILKPGTTHLSSLERRSSFSTANSSKDKVSARFKKSPQLKSGSHWESVEDGTLSPDITIVRDSDIHHRRNRHRQRNNIETLDERVHSHRNKLLPSVHFDGDTSKYVLGRHTNFNGDGHLRHLSRRYVDWASPVWVNSLEMDEHFTLNDGFLKIKETGLYFIYAQIFYLDEHDTNGYRVYKNLETLLQCTVTTHSTSRILKSNTCYTSGVAHLVDGDQISLQDLADGRYSLFEVGKSFFGVVKLGDIRNK